MIRRKKGCSPQEAGALGGAARRDGRASLGSLKGLPDVRIVDRRVEAAAGYNGPPSFPR